MLFGQELWAAETEQGELEIPSKTISLWSLYTIKKKILIPMLGQPLVLMPVCFMTNNEPSLYPWTLIGIFKMLDFFISPLQFNYVQVFHVRLFDFDYINWLLDTNTYFLNFVLLFLKTSAIITMRNKFKSNKDSNNNKACFVFYKSIRYTRHNRHIAIFDLIRRLIDAWIIFVFVFQCFIKCIAILCICPSLKKTLNSYYQEILTR